MIFCMLVMTVNLTVLLVTGLENFDVMATTSVRYSISVVKAVGSNKIPCIEELGFDQPITKIYKARNRSPQSSPV